MLKFDNRIYYEITHRCNLSCIHCCNSSRKDAEKLSISEINQFQMMMAKYGITNSVLTGGEPTIRKDFESIVNILTRYGNVFVTTNGTYYPANKYIELLKEYSNLHFQISLDGFTDESHDKIRGSGTFEKTMNTISAIIDEGYSNRLHISCIVTKWNIREMYNMIQFAEKNKVGSLYFPRLISAGRGMENWHEIAPSLDDQKLFEMSVVQKLAKEENPIVCLNRFSHFVASYHMGKRKCALTLKIAPDGVIYPCLLCSDKKWSLGDVRSVERLEDIENRYNKISVDRFRDREECKICEIIDMCPQNYCEICKFNSDSSKISEEEMKYQCKINKIYIEGLLEEE